MSQLPKTLEKPLRAFTCECAVCLLVHALPARLGIARGGQDACQQTCFEWFKLNCGLTCRTNSSRPAPTLIVKPKMEWNLKAGVARRVSKVVSVITDGDNGECEITGTCKCIPACIIAADVRAAVVHCFQQQLNEHGVGLSTKVRRLSNSSSTACELYVPNNMQGFTADTY